MDEIELSDHQNLVTNYGADFELDSTRSLNVKRVPESVWRHARVNAHMSGATFRNFIIYLMATSKPIRPLPLDSNYHASEVQ